MRYAIVIMPNQNIMGEIEQYWEETDNENWRKFVKVCAENWTNSSEQINLLEKVKGNKDIAIVLNYQLGKEAIEWIEKQIPILDYLSPMECLEKENLKTRLRMALWRFP